MSDDTRLSTWADVTEDAYRWVADAIRTGDLGPDADVDRWVNETAEACQHVIWHANAYSLWRDQSAPDWSEDPEPSTDPDQLLTAYALQVVERALHNAVEALTGENAPEGWGLCRDCQLPVIQVGLGVIEVRPPSQGGSIGFCPSSFDLCHHWSARP